ncbi:MAG: beta-lactamase family protein [Acidobacteria bacterium]|nr:beta-lactamase family protein [Acidobacteriota bacterium]
MSGPAHARQIVSEAVRARVFPAAAVDVGTSRDSLWSEAFGTLTFDAEAAPAMRETLFDLASLTKVIATVSVAMDLVTRGAMRLDEPVRAFFPEWVGRGREATTVADLLEHAAGLPARLVDAPPSGRREFEHEICAIALEYEPRTGSLYSDLDFILLGFLLAARGGATLAAQFDAIAGALGAGPLPFAPEPPLRRLAAPTLPLSEDPRRGRLLAGEVHDSYASALGGVAGHAGLFGTAGAVGAFARVVLRALRNPAGAAGAAEASRDASTRWPAHLVARFAARSCVPGSSRALGWDTMLPTSSCGTRMSATAIGHTGFTGTSLWIDPERDRYFVLLANRVCSGGTLAQMRQVRRAFHDAAAAI